MSVWNYTVKFESIWRYNSWHRTLQAAMRKSKTLDDIGFSTKLKKQKHPQMNVGITDVYWVIRSVGKEKYQSLIPELQRYQELFGVYSNRKVLQDMVARLMSEGFFVEVSLESNGKYRVMKSVVNADELVWTKHYDKKPRPKAGSKKITCPNRPKAD